MADQLFMYDCTYRSQGNLVKGLVNRNYSQESNYNFLNDSFIIFLVIIHDVFIFLTLSLD